MPLVEIRLKVGREPVPRIVEDFLREARRRMEKFQEAHVIPGFVPSHFERVYHALRYLNEEGRLAGNRFCEWGSGFGMVACLAGMVGFEACGIEIEGQLVDEARQLADHYHGAIPFYQGSFIPPGGENLINTSTAMSWLSLQPGDAHGLHPADFDLIFNFPWPGQEAGTKALFLRFAKPGAVLLTHYEGGELHAWKKPGRV